jgi:TatD DNase family protein
VIALIDCHAHLHDAEFDGDRTAVIERAAAAGVTTIVTAGTDIAASRAAVALAEREPMVLATVGIHPHEAASTEDLQPLRELASSRRVVAIGEIGLDYHYDHSPRDVQRRRFAEQLDMSLDLGLPVVIHSRDADADTRAILAPWAARCRAAQVALPYGVMHCYSYGAERLAAYTELGLAISLPGIVTYPKAIEVQGSAQAANLDMLVLETDCPYLAPQSRRGRRNEPALIAETAARVAALRGITLEALAERTTANARRLFRIRNGSTLAPQ